MYRILKIMYKSIDIIIFNYLRQICNILKIALFKIVAVQIQSYNIAFKQ